MTRLGEREWVAEAAGEGLREVGGEVPGGDLDGVAEVILTLGSL